ncbi:MAG: prepilin-type N-terminal cleavage/methylation domain-containing protein [Planctomycetes bacterium]|nr:prepilin-type N-terminal cleavage/methylation domain-containing protein [Planctomycetota bacterium]
MKKAFTLIELLVVISIIAILMAVLVPSLGKAKSVARSVICRSNVRQLVMSNLAYASENDGYFVLAAEDIDTGLGGLYRWHGVRDTSNDPFDARRSALASYLADGAVKQCSKSVKFRQNDPWAANFEDGCGGYGYNMTYLGSRIWQDGFGSCDKATRQTEMCNSSETVMFADTAMAKLDSGIPYFLEYSFVEPPYFLSNGVPEPAWGYASPSIHFRHENKANIGWADGHVDAHERAEYDGINVYGVKSADMNLGWLNPIDNRAYDLK